MPQPVWVTEGQTCKNFIILELINVHEQVCWIIRGSNFRVETLPQKLQLREYYNPYGSIKPNQNDAILLSETL